jgi:pimeloyl-ACP methyl ester carboxylesterase
MERRNPLVEQVTRGLLRTLRYESVYVPTSVGRVHLWSARGTGPLPPLLLFHGLGASGLHWMPLLLQLRPKVRSLLAIDLPGHGFSDRPPSLSGQVLAAGISEALDQLDLEPALVVGNSLGGAAAVRYVNARPARALGAMLFSPAGAPMTAEELDAVRARFRVERHLDAVRFVRQLHGRPVGPRAHLMAPLFRRSLADPTLRRWLESVGPGDFLAPQEVRSLPVPVEVVWGLQERMLPARLREFWRENLPSSGALVEPEGVGHSPFLDDRRWAVARLLGFAERIAAQGAEREVRGG